MHAQSFDGENFAQRGTRARQGSGRQMVVADEVDTIEEETEDDRQVALTLNSVVLFLQGPHKSVSQVWGRQLKYTQSQIDMLGDIDLRLHTPGEYLTEQIMNDFLSQMKDSRIPI